MLDRSLAEALRRAGFRKWYERELLSGHAHMVLAVLSVVGLLGGFEAMRVGQGGGRLGNVLLVAVCAAIGLWALRRYLFLLTRAEEAANQANCGGCGDYARFVVVGGRGTEAEVECRRCGHRWTITLGS